MRLNFCPLGACALAGTGLPIDRFMTSAALDFTAPMKNRYAPWYNALVGIGVDMCLCAVVWSFMIRHFIGNLQKML